MRKVDLTGQVFGRGTVISKSGNKNNRTMWNMQCECGNTYQTATTSLQLGHTKSCGCLRQDIARRSTNQLHISNKRDITTAGLMMLYASYKSGAKKRNLVFDLTIDQFKDITSRYCDYCGIKPLQIKTGRRSHGQYTYNGIDRVDNTKGYTIDNVTACCKICNRAKREMSHAEFEQWLDQIVHFRSIC